METIYQFNSDDHFLHRLDVLQNSIRELGVIMDANSRAQQVGRPPQYVVHQHQWRRVVQKRSPALLFPFSLLATGIDGLLTRGDQAVGRWVKEGIIARWMQRIRSWLRKRKRA
jgi:hypothetical protein